MKTDPKILIKFPDEIISESNPEFKKLLIDNILVLIDWDDLGTKGDLPEEFIEKYIHNFNAHLLKHQKMSEEFLLKHAHRFRREDLFWGKQELNEKLLRHFLPETMYEWRWFYANRHKFQFSKQFVLDYYSEINKANGKNAAEELLKELNI